MILKRLGPSLDLTLSVALSADATTVVIGAPYNREVEYDVEYESYSGSRKQKNTKEKKAVTASPVPRAPP